MIPSRGLRWSSQAIGIGRRHLEPFSARQFSSSVQIAPIRSSPLLYSSASILRTHPRSQVSKTHTLIRNSAGIRFASTSPATIASAATSTDPTTAVSSSAASTSEFATSSLDNALDFTSDSIYNIPEHIGYLKSLGLDYGWGPTAGMEWILEHIHIYAGTPWWVSIALAAVVVRAALFKPYVNAAENASRMHAIQPVTKPITAKMTEAMKNGDQTTAMQLRQELSMINKRAGIKMWKSFVPIIQVFAGYGIFVLLRGMSRLPVPGLETGGILWFHNLTIPDPYFLLPIATAGILHWVLRRGGETGATTMSPQAMTLFMYAMPAVSFLFTWWLPAAVQLSFLTSGVLSFGQASLFKMPAFRRYFNMQPLPTAAAPTTPDGKPPTPYRGDLKVRAPLTQAELNSAFQESRKQSMLDKARKSMMDATKEIRTAGGTVAKSAKGTFDNRSKRNENTNREAFEKKRQEEVRNENEERKQRRFQERAAKKRARHEE